MSTLELPKTKEKGTNPKFVANGYSNRSILVIFCIVV